MKKIFLNFCLVIILFLLSIFKSFSQKPEDLIGTWKGKYTEELLTTLTLDYTIVVEKLSGDDLVIDVKYENRSDGKKDRHDRILAYYKFIRGNDFIWFGVTTTIKGTKKSCHGQLMFKVDVKDGVRYMKANFLPDKETDVPSSISVELTNVHDVKQLSLAKNEQKTEPTAPDQKEVNKEVAGLKKDDKKYAGRGVDLLFKGTKSKLTDAQKQSIFKQTRFEVFDEESFTNEATFETSFSAGVCMVDLNFDGIEEVFIAYGNHQTSGMVSHSLMIFRKATAQADYKLDVDEPGIGAEVLYINGKSFPNLMLYGTSDHYKVITWDGSKYKSTDWLTKKITGLKAADLLELSEIYQTKGVDAMKAKLLTTQKGVVASNTPSQSTVQKTSTVKIPLAKKGDPKKFIGNWRDVGSFSSGDPIYAVGNKYHVGSNFDKDVPLFSFNSKLDRLECPMVMKGQKHMVVIVYNYTKNRIRFTVDGKPNGLEMERVPEKQP